MERILLNISCIRLFSSGISALIEYKKLFIEHVILKTDDSRIRVRNVKRMDLINDIDRKIDGVRSILGIPEEQTISGTLTSKAFKILRNMRIDSMTTESYNDLERKIREMEEELHKVSNKKLVDMWRDDLKDLMNVLPADVL